MDVAYRLALMDRVRQWGFFRQAKDRNALPKLTSVLRLNRGSRTVILDIGEDVLKVLHVG